MVHPDDFDHVEEEVDITIIDSAKLDEQARLAQKATEIAKQAEKANKKLMSLGNQGMLAAGGTQGRLGQIAQQKDPHGKLYGNFSLMQQNIIIMQYVGYEKDRYFDCTGEFMGANWSCAGCMEQTACNYNSGATIEDYSCELPIEGYNCYGEKLFNDSSIIPANFLLSIYPNPFNPITTISFTIREFGFTTITAYNITGRKLQTLINEVLGVGNYSINWNASSYPSGVYLIRMDNGKFTQTQKVVLIK